MSFSISASGLLEDASDVENFLADVKKFFKKYEPKLENLWASVTDKNGNESNVTKEDLANVTPEEVNAVAAPVVAGPDTAQSKTTVQGKTTVDNYKVATAPVKTLGYDPMGEAPAFEHPGQPVQTTGVTTASVDTPQAVNDLSTRVDNLEAGQQQIIDLLKNLSK